MTCSRKSKMSDRSLRILAIGPELPSGRSSPKGDVSGEESAQFHPAWLQIWSA